MMGEEEASHPGCRLGRGGGVTKTNYKQKKVHTQPVSNAALFSVHRSCAGD